MSNISSSSAKNHSIHSKKLNNSRERDKSKSIASESGGSSQCDTPPLTEKDGTSSQGKFAGVGADSIQCMAEQIGVDLNAEAATNLAEDISYKLRQAISTIALHSEMMKKSRVESWDVNTVLTLADTSPVIGTCTPQYVPVGDEKICCEVETLVNVKEFSLTTQNYVYSSLPTLSVEWITADKSLNNNSNISVSLQNYFTKVARAILNLKKKPKQVAVDDLTTNTCIGPIFPNLFNLAVLVLNDDNLNALNVPAKKPLQSNVLDMVDALCSNPCSFDTNIQQQFQRLFPVMVSNILGNGSLAEKMVAILTKITRTWPSFIAIGKGILFDYLSQGTKERLTAPMIRCVCALGRQALLECLAEHLDYLDRGVAAGAMPGVRETLLEASTCLLRSEPTTYLEDYVMTDYTLYEMLGDSIMPRRLLFPGKETNIGNDNDIDAIATRIDTTTSNSVNTEKSLDEEFSYLPLRPLSSRPKVKLIPSNRKIKINVRESVFQTSKLSVKKCIYIKVKNCRALEPVMRLDRTPFCSVKTSRINGVAVASGVLNRFKYRIIKPSTFPIFGALML